jgi:hypothetical protein
MAAVPTTPAGGSPVRLVAVPLAGVPNTGVTKDGLVENTAEPEPVSLVNAVARCAEVNEPNTVALPVEVMWPVRFALVVTFPAVKLAAVPDRLVATPDAGVPRAGVTNVGLVANTNEPDPVSSVTAEARLADEDVARKVATPVASPVIPPTATDPAEPDAFPVNAPTNVVVVRELVFELKVRPALDFGPRSPVAAVTNVGKQVVSVASLATVI